MRIRPAASRRRLTFSTAFEDGWSPFRPTSHSTIDSPWSLASRLQMLNGSPVLMPSWAIWSRTLGGTNITRPSMSWYMTSLPKRPSTSWPAALAKQTSTGRFTSNDTFSFMGLPPFRVSKQGLLVWRIGRLRPECSPDAIAIFDHAKVFEQR